MALFTLLPPSILPPFSSSKAQPNPHPASSSLHKLRRPFKRPAISDQQRRRELVLLRQTQRRSDSQNRARRLASSILSLPGQPLPDVAQTNRPDAVDEDYALALEQSSELEAISHTAGDLDVVQTPKLKGIGGPQLVRVPAHAHGMDD